jgi:hypothetical protein
VTETTPSEDEILVSPDSVTWVENTVPPAAAPPFGVATP